MRTRPWGTRTAQSGIALIEALIGILIFAFGVLGLVGLQAAMTSAQTSAKFRGDASNLASELIGVMWADSPTNYSKYTTTACADYLRCADWAAKTAKVLPGGTVALAYSGVTGEISITVSWSQPDGSTNKFTTVTRVRS